MRTEEQAIRAALAAFLDVPVKFVGDCPRITRAMERAIETWEREKGLRDPVGEFPEGDG